MICQSYHTSPALFIWRRGVIRRLCADCWQTAVRAWFSGDGVELLGVLFDHIEKYHKDPTCDRTCHIIDYFYATIENIYASR